MDQADEPSYVGYTHRMSKRLQVIMGDDEYQELEAAARADDLTVSEWVRSAIRLAKNRRPQPSAETKLKAVAVGFQHSFPTGDIEQMLGEIEAGYR